MKVSQVMTPEPACCLPQDTVDIAARLMRIQDVGMIPVINDESERHLIGVVTDRDLAILVVGQGLEPRKTVVGDVMSRNIIACKETDSVQEVLNAMKSYQVRRIPVVAEDRGLAGVVSQSDIALRLKNPETTGEVVADISLPNFPQEWRELGSQIKTRWSRLTEKDIEDVLTDRENLIFRLQERYDMHQSDAEREVAQFREKLLKEI